MFKKNTKHLQPALISAASELPEKQLKLLKGSWARAFYREFFSRINEEIFSILYSSEPSRPNIPVNVMVGLEVMKAGFGWNDAELYENYCFNLQVRYALGYDRLGDGDFAIRTLYNFRERLSKYNIEKGINLLEKAFEQITDAQIKGLQVRTGMQRMDSTQIASNIVDASRLRLLVEAIQRTHRIISETDQARLEENFAAYLKGSAGHYTYRVKGKEAIQEHLQQVGTTIHILLAELKEAYAEEKAYQVLERIFTEHFNLVDNDVCPKENQELSSGSLQSVDDLEASYRTKGNAHYKGYVANITETCDPENDLQLITKVQVAPNNTDDDQLLAEALPPNGWIDPSVLLYGVGSNAPEKYAHGRVAPGTGSAIVFMMIYAGLRISEIENLRSGDIVLRDKSGEIDIFSGKGDKDRTAALPLEARKALEEWLELHPECEHHFAFTVTRKGHRPLGRRAVQEMVVDVGRKVELDKAGIRLTPHLLRHTAVYLWCEENDPFVVAAQMGHKDINTTMRYGRPSGKDLRRAAAKIR
jgi:hypothetical protein